MQDKDLEITYVNGMKITCMKKAALYFFGSNFVSCQKDNERWTFRIFVRNETEDKDIIKFRDFFGVTINRIRISEPPIENILEEKSGMYRTFTIANMKKICILVFGSDFLSCKKEHQKGNYLVLVRYETDFELMEKFAKYWGVDMSRLT